MPCFSFTAPQFSEEDEKAERLALTEKEKIEINHDIFGSDDEHCKDDCEQNHNKNDCNRDCEMITSLIQKVEEDIRNLPTNEILDYLHAIENVPDLVRTETNIILFLEYEEYNTLATAKRLVQYWKVRKEIFGNTLAYLPMKLNINGSMKDNINDFEKGLVQILPTDRNGRTVMFWDRIRTVQSIISVQAILRILFYTYHIIFNKETKKERSLVTIINLKVSK